MIRATTIGPKVVQQKAILFSSLFCIDRGKQVHNTSFCYLTTQTIAGRFYCREARSSVTSGDKFLHPSPKHVSCQKHPSLAFEAFEADVGAQPQHFSLVAAARVCFAQPDYITELYFYGH
jgi:hypothetical protein